MAWLDSSHRQRIIAGFSKTLHGKNREALEDTLYGISRLEDAIILRVITGMNGVGQVDCMGASVGDLILGFVNLTDQNIGSGIFSVTVTQANKIEQINVGDYSAKKFLVMILKK